MLKAAANGSEAVASPHRTALSLGLGLLSGFGFALAAGVGTILYWFDPSKSQFYPTCLFHQATGYLCPGCGSLRAIHQLLHGNVSAAFRFNALLVLSLPLIGWLAGRYALGKFRSRPTPAGLGTRWIFLWLAVAVAFTVWRNLPRG